MTRSILAILVTPLLACLNTSRPSVADQPTTEEDTAIIRVVVADDCLLIPPAYYVFASDPLPINDLASRGLSRSDPAVENLLERARQPNKNIPIPKCPGIRGATEREIRTTFETKSPVTDTANPGWEGFYSHFNGAKGVIRVSLPGYSSDHKRAVIVVSGYRGLLAGAGALLELRKIGSEWRVTKRESLWVS